MSGAQDPAAEGIHTPVNAGGFARIHPRGSAPPLVWMVPSPSQAYAFRELGSDQPIIGIRPFTPRVDAPPDSLKALCFRYAEVVNRAQPEGPIRIAGYCIGAVLAREVARELADSGRKIAALIMIDPPDPAESRAQVTKDPWIFRMRALFSRTGYHMQRIMRSKDPGPWGYMAESWREMIRRFRYRIGKRAYQSALEENGQLPVQLQDSYHSSIAAYMNSELRPYNGDAVIVRPLDVPHGVFDYADRRWEKLINGGITFQSVAGDSNSMWNPENVSDIVQIMRSCL